MPYIEGEFDCADLARLVQREVFGREIALPGSRDYLSKSGPDKVAAMAAQLEACKFDVARPVHAPSDGDGALLISRAKTNHVGLWCLIAGVGWVLHAASTQRQVVLMRVRDMERYGLRIEGYYAWI